VQQNQGAGRDSRSIKISPPREPLLGSSTVGESQPPSAQNLGWKAPPREVGRPPPTEGRQDGSPPDNSSGLSPLGSNFGGGKTQILPWKQLPHFSRGSK